MCVCVCCACVCARHCEDISIGRPILSSLRVDFKGEEISSGFSRLVNSLSPESGVILTRACALSDGVCLSVCTCVHVCLGPRMHTLTAKAPAYGY